MTECRGFRTGRARHHRFRHSQLRRGYTQSLAEPTWHIPTSAPLFPLQVAGPSDDSYVAFADQAKRIQARGQKIQNQVSVKVAPGRGVSSRLLFSCRSTHLMFFWLGWSWLRTAARTAHDLTSVVRHQRNFSDPSGTCPSDPKCLIPARGASELIVNVACQPH